MLVKHPAFFFVLRGCASGRCAFNYVYYMTRERQSFKTLVRKVFEEFACAQLKHLLITRSITIHTNQLVF